MPLHYHCSPLARVHQMGPLPLAEDKLADHNSDEVPGNNCPITALIRELLQDDPSRE